MMKIKNIIAPINKLNTPIINKFKNTGFVKDVFGEKIRVQEIDYKGSKIPYVYEEKNSLDNFELDDTKDNIKKAFRDDELFNEQEDIVDFSYSKYDDNDVIPSIKYILSVAEDYLQKRKVQTDKNQYFDTGVEYPHIKYLKVYDNRDDKFDYFEMKAKKILQNEQKEAKKKIDKMSYLRKGIKSIYSFELNDCILDKYKRNHPLSEIEEVIKLSKKESQYIEKKQKFIQETVSCSRIDKYFDLKEKKKIKDVAEYTKLIKFGDESYWGKEGLVFDLITDLSQKAPLDKVIKTYSDTYKFKMFSSVTCEETKQKQYEEMLEKLEIK